ncbi:MAG: methionine--tRNA ligase [Nanoarchaeota archaeon]|nr:methionine--tRNA ligase [Nanoarchaeota archaeon]
MKTFFISTAIDYPSYFPHAGHLYEKVVSDIIARWKRSEGYKVHFSTGLDCHGSKIEKASEKAGKKPEKFVEDMGKYFLKLCKDYNISYDDFIRTTEERHKKVVKELINKINTKGDIYKGEYSGYYCSDCETYFSKEELNHGNCPVHGKPAEILKEESYFFKMSKYQKKLIEHIKKNPNFIRPETNRNEILSRLKEPLKDLSITRLNVKWGIPFPLNNKFTLAIWVEALMNYISTLDYPNEKYKEFWPALHIIGRDIVWHHTVIWGSLLMSLNIKLPEVYVHGFIKSDSGEKMSKSKGNIIDPLKLIKKYPADTIRYFLAREIPFGQDGNFSEKALINRINNELANELGNLISRTLNLCKKLPKINSYALDLEFDIKEISSLMHEYKITEALNEIWRFVQETNKYINKKQPWTLEKLELEEILYNCLEAIRKIAILLEPFMPETSQKIFNLLNIKNQNLTTFEEQIPTYKTKPPEILFKKIQ